MVQYTPSPQQQAFYTWVRDSKGNLVLEAVAGAGKTSSLLAAFPLMRGSLSYIVFNKKNAVEAEQKAKKQGVMRNDIRIQTAHSAGFSALRATYKGLTTDEKKVEKLANSRAMSEKQTQAVPYVCRMISFAKQSLFDVNTDSSEWLALSEHFGAEESLPDNSISLAEAISFAREVFRTDLRTWESNQTIDFDDMVYLPAMGFGRVWQNQWVLIDEAQDTNLARRKLAARMLSPSGRLVAVGDRHQALYAFTGADSGALDLIARDFKATRLPLSVSFRCPKAVVRYAQNFVSHIEAAPEAPEGEVVPLVTTIDTVVQEQWLQPTAITDPENGSISYHHSAIVCRYNRPLAALAFALIRRNVPCRIEGRDIGKSLVALVSKWKSARTIEDLRGCLNKWLAMEQDKAKKAGNERKAQSAEDRVATVEVFMERCEEQGKDSVACVKAEIEQMFADNVTGMLVLSSIHKSKGREWPHVMWLQIEGGRPPRKQWEIDTEICACYVATTRAQQRLTLLTIPEIG